MAPVSTGNGARAAVALLAALLACLVLAAATATRAAAAPGVQYGLTDDAWLLDGPGTLDSRIARLSALGVQVVRFTLHWNEIAAARPAAPPDPAEIRETPPPWPVPRDAVCAFENVEEEAALDYLRTVYAARITTTNELITGSDREVRSPERMGAHV